MDPASQSWALIFGWMGIIVIAIFGLGIMASRSTNIERPNMVGLLTFLGAAVSAVLLQRAVALNGPFSWFQTIGIVIVGLGFFGWARLLDYLMGPVPVDREADEDMMGAHLSD